MNLIFILVLALSLVLVGLACFKYGYLLGHQAGWREGMNRGLRWSALKSREAEPYQHSRN